MTAAGLAAWRKRLGLTQTEASAKLGCGRRTLQNYEAGLAPVPLYFALACAAIALGIPPQE